MGRKNFVIPKGKKFKAKSLNISVDYAYYLSLLMSNRKDYVKYNYFADLLSGLRTKEDKSISTFCIQVHQGYYLMRYSPEMVKELTPLAAGMVIAHELGHAALNHIPRMMKYYDMFSHDKIKMAKAAAVIHVAADYALNSWLIDTCGIFSLSDLKTKIGKPCPEAPTWRGNIMGSYAGIHPSDVGLPLEKSMEYYAWKLAKDINEKEWDVSRIVNPNGPKEGEGEGDSSGGSNQDGDSSEDSTMMGELSKAASTMTDEQLEELLGRAGISVEDDLENYGNGGGSKDDQGNELSTNELADRLSRDFVKRMLDSMESCKSKGSMPGSIEQYIEEITREPEVDWRKKLQEYSSTAKPAKKRTRLNALKRKCLQSEKGFETCEYFGKKKDPCYRIAFAIDTSGSVSNAEMQEIFTELKGIMNSNAGTVITVIECDATVNRVYDLTNEIDTNVTGRGGTSFDPVFQWLKGPKDQDEKDYYEEKNIPLCNFTPDLLIYATDGECYLPKVDLRIPKNKMLWLLTSRGSLPTEGMWHGPEPTEVTGYCDYGKYIKLPSY